MRVDVCRYPHYPFAALTIDFKENAVSGSLWTGGEWTCSLTFETKTQKRGYLTKIIFCLMFGALLSQASTIVTYDLGTDFSNTSNPNGVWSFLQGTTALPLMAQPTDSNPLNPAAANGYFGVSANFAVAPFVLEASENGSAASPFTNNDFLAGDVLVHSTNPGAGAPVFVDWTAPGAGTITLSGEVWYAHSPVTRSNDYSLTLGGGSSLASGTVTNGDGLNAPSTFAITTSMTVTPGEVLALELTPTAGQTFGSLSGVDLTVNLTTTGTPEPGTTLLLAGGLLGMAVAAKLRRPASTRS
jgi:hypothetical protein